MSVFNLFSRTGKVGPAASQPKLPLPGPTAPRIAAVPKHEAQDAELDVISNPAELPKGEYIAFVDDRGGPLTGFRDSFAAFRAGPDTATLLMVPEEQYARTMFEITRRLKKQGFVNVENRCATREMIRTCHQEHVASGVATAADEQTENFQIALQLLSSAVEKGSSDIHIETREKRYASVLFRVHGERIQQPSLAFETAEKLVRALYMVHADQKSSETSWKSFVPQDTKIDKRIPVRTASGVRDVPVQIRFHSSPIYPGDNFQAVMRLLVAEARGPRELSESGYTEAMCAAISEALTGSSGIVLFVGPTNSGKTTALSSCVRMLYDECGENIKLVTVEDPVEIQYPRACQMSVQEQAGASYASLLRATLRQDPDAALLGEIRDAEATSTVQDLGLAGHKILSTLHAFEAMAAFQRLIAMGLPPDILFMSGFVSAIVYQRLVPLACPSCSVPIKAVDAAFRKRHAGLFTRLEKTIPNVEEEGIRFRRPEGCDQCNYTGIVDRTPCAEVLIPTDEMLAALRAGDEPKARAVWAANRELNVDGYGVRAVAHGIQKMRHGLVDPRDVERKCGLLTTATSDFSASVNDLSLPTMGKMGVLGRVN